MFRTGIGLTLLLGLLADVSQADIPLPPNLQYVDPVVSFEGIAKLVPEYEFRLRYLTFVGGPNGVPYTYKKVSGDGGFALGASRRLMDMQLLGLKRDEFQRREKEDPSLRWLNDKTPGVLAAEVSSPSTVAERGRPVPAAQYRVSLKDGKLTVERIEEAEKKAGAASPWATWIAGIALSLGIAGLGLWLSRGVRAGRFDAATANPAV
jgi:hypothetical protein